MASGATLPIFTRYQLAHPNLSIGFVNPYTKEHAIEWLTTIKGQTDKSLERFNAGSDSDGLSIGDICPVRSIREIVGEVDNYIGDIGIGRLLDSKLLTGESDKDWEEKNGSLPAGDPRIVWTIGGT